MHMSSQLIINKEVYIFNNNPYVFMIHMPMSGHLIIHKMYMYIQHSIYNGSGALMIRIPISSQLIIN